MKVATQNQSIRESSACQRLLNIYLVGLSAFFRKLRYDLVKELTVALCSLCILAVVFYIFNDFVNIEVASMSRGLQRFLGSGVTWFILVGSALIGGRVLHREFSGARTYVNMMSYMGESPEVKRVFFVLRCITMILVVHGAAWAISLLAFVDWSFLRIALIESGLLGVSFVVYKLSCVSLSGTEGETECAQEKFREVGETEASPGTMHSPLSTMIVWRLRQMFFRNRLSQLAMIMTALIIALFTVITIRGEPFFIALLTALLAGVVLSSVLALQVQEDLKSAWAERTLGVSHELFLETYVRIGWILGGALFGLILLIQILVWAVKGVPLAGTDLLFLFSDYLKAGAVAALPPYLMHLFFFQIDARKPMLQIIMVFVAGLFLATAIYASWLSLLLVLILKYYTLEAEKGRFYRA